MAAAEPSQVISSLPLPPVQYINLYSNENVSKNRAPKPPTPFSEYSMFGNSFNNEDSIIRPLESQGIKRLYPQHFDRKKELKKLNHSLLVNFLDLIDLLILSPDSPKRTEKIDDLTLLFVHIHHLLNEYRPHQARETLRVLMDLQKRQRLETAKRFNFHLEKVREIVNNAFSTLLPVSEIKTEPGLDVEMDVDMENDCSLQMEGVDQNDKLMCEIIDLELPLN
ncbi:unnamed protein product [Diamesa serratosioi]